MYLCTDTLTFILILKRYSLVAAEIGLRMSFLLTQRLTVDVLWCDLLEMTFFLYFIHEVRGHKLRSKVIWGQVVSKAENVRIEKLGSPIGTRQFIDEIWEPSYVVKVTKQGQNSAEVNGKC